MKQAADIGIDQIGFASADPFDELRQRLVQHRELGYESGFEESDLDLRTSPSKNLPSVKTIIAIALAYPSRMKNPPQSAPGAYRGIFARASWGKDYHHVLRQKLDELANRIKERIPTAELMSMVDTGALSDRAVAQRAGIGWSGKNTSIITHKFGSWVYLGEMLTNLSIPPDQPIEDGCGDCNRCIEACPTGALVGPGQLNAKACIAFLTQTKESIPTAWRKKIGNRLYGCDTCQTVCPKNRKLSFTHQKDFAPDPERVKPLLKPLLKMSNREFRQQYCEMAGSWRGKKPIQRNAIIALAHFRDQSAIPDLAELLAYDPRPVIRQTAAWALGEIGGSQAEKALRKAEHEEDEQVVREEINQALQTLEQQNEK
ncbi:tRNA epoxyqueuosine(34) reductase QueG [Seinonella peptonophila]|nr:tRNA epoxyqueuosine(34) reductase QueG [Seinonella peptonophila]